jgi:amino acid permease
MKKFSFSWKVFLVINFIQMAVYLLLFSVLTVTLTTVDRYQDSDSFLPVFLFAASLLLIAINCSINLHVLYRYFPDKSLPVKTKVLLISLWIINLLLFIGILYVCIIAYKDQVNYEYQSPRRNNTSMITLILLFITWLMGVYILIGQIQIPGYLNRNNKKKMATLIDSIGESKQD